MLYQWLRVFDSDNGALTDLSIDNQDKGVSMPFDLVVDEDYIYLAKHFPWNNFFIKGSTFNTVAANLNIEYWSGEGNGWKTAVDILDGTVVNGVPLARNGVIQFSPQVGFIWHRVADSKDEPMPFGLESLNITNAYWLRISYDASLDASTAIETISYAFTRSQQLDILDTQIDEFMTSFKAGKTDWDDEIMVASIQVVNELKRRGLVVSEGQVLRFDEVTMAADYRTLILIYKNLGPGFNEKKEEAWKEYEYCLNTTRWTFDKDFDATVDSGEIKNRVGKLVR
jgi:hypothetical protein